jgi:hypothetical protein
VLIALQRIKYSSADTKNRIGLRELLMDPVQRIPRYTLMLHTMIKRMSPGDPQRAKLVEAVEIASKIAQAEVDEETRRASVMFCLRTTIDGFPPGLISHSRRLIDYIDVEDTFIDGLPSAPSGSGALESLHCTLFLFDDKLMIVKRPGNGEKSGQVLAGLDQLEKIAKGSGVPSGLKKSGMGCKGVVDLTDVVATDVGGTGMSSHLSIATLLSDLRKIFTFSSRSLPRIRLTGGPGVLSDLCLWYFRLTRPISTHNKQKPTKPVFWRTSGSPRRTFVRGLANR